ncbi:MAG: hypothetical protein GX295_02080 [Syntrophomonadaceae bacterium]|nr:hypothetical protein [Syntrophomonadaceae bacterium]
MVWWLSLLFGGIIVWVVPGLVKRRKWGELLTFSLLLLASMVYGYGMCLDWSLPNPNSGLEMIFGPVTRYLEELLS